MSWIFDHTKLGHRVFIAFIELKLDGNWKKFKISSEDNIVYDVLAADTDEGCNVHIIEPDGLRRDLHLTKGGTISIHQNIFSYHPDQAKEIDDKSKQGKTRNKL